MKIIRADLLDFPEDINIIAHSANCQNKMGSGIAKKIRERYLEAYVADCAIHKKMLFPKYLLGDFSIAFVTPGKSVANLYTQLNYGTDRRQVNYEAFYKSLEKLSSTYPNLKIGLPYGISCGLAGGSWKIISAIIEDIEASQNRQFTICKL